ncbi:MAG: hypothetical protein ACOX9E_14325 [Lentisphaeria bacterium]
MVKRLRRNMDNMDTMDDSACLLWVFSPQLRMSPGKRATRSPSTMST